MAIHGVGTDIVEIERIRRSLQRHGKRFQEKIFTPSEQAYCNKYKDSAPNYAGRFAAKEAISKALGTGFGEHLSWLDLEILPNNQGAPCVHWIKDLAIRFKNYRFHLSISHSENYAVATVVIEI
ncbi:MAG: holo-[acyl-carrier-protein] synthase [Waddliaceae bacterium]|nr:holo-[acyl-carrier-protein] synthase [Waddliaceae bacterium]